MLWLGFFVLNPLFRLRTVWVRRTTVAVSIVFPLGIKLLAPTFIPMSSASGVAQASSWVGAFGAFLVLAIGAWAATAGSAAADENSRTRFEKEREGAALEASNTFLKRRSSELRQKTVAMQETIDGLISAAEANSEEERRAIEEAMECCVQKTQKGGGAPPQSSPRRR